MSKQYCIRDKFLHGPPKFSLKTKFSSRKLKKANILFIIPIIIIIQGHIFGIYIINSEIHDNVNLLLGVKTFAECEGEINMRNLTFEFLNRVVPILLYTKK